MPFRGEGLGGSERACAVRGFFSRSRVRRVRREVAPLRRECRVRAAAAGVMVSPAWAEGRRARVGLGLLASPGGSLWASREEQRSETRARPTPGEARPRGPFPRVGLSARACEAARGSGGGNPDARLLRDPGGCVMVLNKAWPQAEDFSV